MLRSEYGGSLSSLSTYRRGPVFTYHTIAPVSEVDESLFGFSNAFKGDANRNGGLGDKSLERDRGRKRKDHTEKRTERQTVQIVTRDLVRSLVIPEQTDTPRSLVLHSTDFDRIKDSARFMSELEQKREAERLRVAQEEEQSGLDRRRNYMKSLDLRRQRSKKSNEIEEDQQRRREALTHRANQQMHEEDEEIKRLNQLIYGAKVHSTRDAQVAEQRAIKRDRLAEDRRLDRAMEVDRRNAVRIEDEIERRRKDERYHGARRIVEQIDEKKEQDRLLELDRRDVENREMRKHVDRLCEEEVHRIRKYRTEQEELREMLDQCNSDLLRRRQFSKEEEIRLERRVVELRRQKAEREEAFEREQTRLRIEKEREVTRLRALQERARDEQAERDALRAKRAEEQRELEWRQRRALEEQEELETAAMLERARAEKLRQKQRNLAAEVQRERAEFERVLRAQEELREKQAISDETKFQRRKEFSEGLRVQMRDRERDREHGRISERSEFSDEATKVDDELRQRRLQLEEMKRRKLEELREAGVQEKYVSQIERRMSQRHLVAI